MRWLILALLIIPAIEIGVFIWVGGFIGPWWVVTLIILTGILGISLAKYQGAETWRKASLLMEVGKVPAEQIVDGICIFVGGVFLLTPGFLTDLFGFTLVIPWTRTPFKKIIYKWIEIFINRKRNGTTFIYRRW